MSARATFSVLRASDEAPHALAWVDAEGELTYRALADAVRALLPALSELRGSVSLVAHANRASVVRLLAAIEAGVPVALLHPRWTETERVAAARLVGVERALEDIEPQSAPMGPLRAPTTLAYVFTSGTTGTPRAASLSHAAFEAATEASAAVLGWTPQDRWLLAMPLAHVGGLSIVLRCLRARRPIVAHRGAFDGPETTRLCARHGVTLLSLVPTMLERLCEPPPASLRVVLVGGAACPEPLRRRALAQGWPVRTTYGLTEMCAQVATQRSADDAGVGPALPGVELSLCDERLFVRGPSRFDGFVGEPPPFDADGFYDTHDYARLDAQGHLTLLGRRSDLIITGGENVYPAEVERALEAVPGVRAACVFGIPDDRWGAVVAAALVAETEARPSEAELDSALDRTLARYKQPRRRAWLDALVVGAGGKLDRLATAQHALRALEPVPKRR